MAVDAPADDVRLWGLCATCRHHVVIANDRGSRFIQCARARTDPRFPRYPRLPVATCHGYELVEPAPDR